MLLRSQHDKSYAVVLLVADFNLFNNVRHPYLLTIVSGLALNFRIPMLLKSVLNCMEKFELVKIISGLFLGITSKGNMKANQKFLPRTFLDFQTIFG